MSLSWITNAPANPNLIFLPCCGMAAVTLGQLLHLVVLRVHASTTNKVNPKYYKLYNVGGEPEYIAKVSQNIENLFEAPPLFYLASIILFLVKGVSPTACTLGWVYVFARLAHSIVHSTSNDVMARFVTYATSTVALVSLWVTTAVAVAASA